MGLNDSSIIYTIGHSNHPIEEFVQLLQENEVRCLVDVRRFPSSKMHPQFNKENCMLSLRESQIKYHWLGQNLGGFQNRDYNEFMQSETFQEGMEHLKGFGIQTSVAIMCAERLYSNCHRRFIANKLAQEGWHAKHILDRGKTYEHQQELL